MSLDTHSNHQPKKVKPNTVVTVAAAPVTEEAQPASAEKPKITPEELRKLFQLYDQSEANVQRASSALETAKDQRSQAIRTIYEAAGNFQGPYRWQGRVLTIVLRHRRNDPDAPVVYTMRIPGEDGIVEI